MNHLQKAFRGLDDAMVETWRRLLKTDPNYFSSWIVVAEKLKEPTKPEGPLLPCMKMRMMGGECPLPTPCRLQRGSATGRRLVARMLALLRRVIGN